MNVVIPKKLDNDRKKKLLATKNLRKYGKEIPRNILRYISYETPPRYRRKIKKIE